MEIKKEIGMPQEENTVALRYEIKNRSSRNVEFVLTPFFQFVPKGADLLPDQEIVFTKGAVESEGMNTASSYKRNDKRDRRDRGSLFLPL